MKMKIKQTLRSMWALVLALLMLLSTFSAVAVTLNVESTGTDYGSSSVTFKAGETIYYDLTGYGKGANIYNPSGNEMSEWKESTSSIISVKLTSDLTITTSSNLFKTKDSSWNGVTCSTLPTSRQNMIVSTDGKTAHWDTYSASSTKTEYYYRGDMNSWKVAKFTMSDDKTYAYYKTDASKRFKLTKGDNWDWQININNDYVVQNPNNNEAADISLSGGEDSGIVNASAGYIVVLYSDNPYYNYTGTGSEKIQVICVSSLDRLNSSTTTTTTTSPTPSTNWYLTGWINKSSVTDTRIPFKQSATDSNIYELTYTFKGNEGGYQYPTIFDGTNAYHPANHGSESGTVGSKVDTTPGNDPKWKVEATTDDTIDFTWNASTKVLSWQKHQATTTYDVTLATGITGGNISSTSTLTGLSGEKTIQLKATPSTGYKFTSWSATSGGSNVTFSSQEATTTATVKGACTITATFEKNSTPDVASGVTLVANAETVEKGNAITLTASLTNKNDGATSVKYSYVQTTNLAGSFTGTVTNIDSTTATFTPTEAGTYKFKVTASCAGYNPVQSSEITVTVTAPADVKADAFSEGMWIDAQPGVTNSADAMVKPYFGTSGKVKFYLPGSVDLTQVHFYHKYGSLKIGDQTIESGNTYNISSWDGQTITYDGTSKTLQIFKSTAKSLYINKTYTTASDGTKTYKDMPTSKVTDGTSASAFKKKCNFGGTYVALTKDGKTINSDKKLKSIKGRGNSSWQASCELFGKYAYNISLGATADLAPGGTPSKKWSMLANNADEAMMRNILVYNLADAIGLDDSPMSDVYDVYNNGTYLGSYQMSEKVEVGESGALVQGKNVDKLNEGANTTTNPDGTKTVSAAYNTDTQTASNGNKQDNSTKGYYKYCAFEAGFVEPTNYKDGNYLLEFELDERFPDETSGFISNYGQQVVLKSPEYASRNEVLYAMDRFNFAEAVIYYLASGSTETSVTLPAGTLTVNSGNYSYTGKDSKNTYSTTNLNLGQLINVENFAKAYLIQEFTENLDGVATSFYVDITGVDDPLVSKPVWDFDWTMGQYNKAKAIGGNQADRNPSLTNQWFIKDKYIYSKSNPNGTNKNIMATLCSIESFWAKVKEVWNGTSSASLLSTGSSSLFPISALMGKKASLNPIGAGTTGVYNTITGLYGENGKIKNEYTNALSSSVAMNEDRYGFIATDSGISNWGSNETGSTWTAAVDYLDNWANKRATWMNAKLNDLPVDEYKVYLKNDANWSSVYAYAWTDNNGTVTNNGAWPGQPMTYNSTLGLYEINLGKEYARIMFALSKDGDKTKELTLGSTNMGKVYNNKTGEWSDLSGSGTNYYLGGRISTAKGNIDAWGSSSKDLKFTLVDGETDLYSFDTGKTVAELSANYLSSANPQYFFIHTGSGSTVAYQWFGLTGGAFTSSNKSITLESQKGTSTDGLVGLVRFNEPGNNSSDKVTLYFNSTTKELYYTAGAVGAYTITKADATNGSFTLSKTTANQGDNITITASPSNGFVVDTVTVTKSSGGTVNVSGTGNTRTFTMPAENVTVSVTFKEGTASDYVVYLDNAAGWATPYAYAWNSDSDKNHTWPGEAMTHVTGNIYRLTFTKEFANIIFSNNGANQTDTLTFGKVNNGKIYNNSTKSWSVYDTDKSITVSAGTCTGGSVTINGSASVSGLKLGDQITLTANADPQYAFTGWGTITGLSITDPNSAQTSASITSVDNNITVTANFSSSKSGYFIKGTFNGWEATNPLYTTSGNVTTTTITLKAGSYTFKVWKQEGNVWYGNNGTIKDTTTTTSPDGWTMNNEGNNTGDCTLEATGGTYTFTFDTSTKKLIITKGAAGNTATVISQDTDGNTLIGESLAYISSYTKVGESTPSANTTSSVNDIEDGTSVIFTAPTNQYYTFKYWLVNGVVTQATEADGVSLKIENVTYDFDVYAVYNYITSNVSIATGIEHGTVETDKTTRVKAGESVTITLTPESGYSTNTVKVTDADGSNIPVNKLSANKYTFVMPNKSVTVSATFALADKYTVTVASNDTSMGTVSTSGGQYNSGDILTVTATANEGYMFAGWYSDAQLSVKLTDENPYTHTVTRDASLYAKFVIKKGTLVDWAKAIFNSSTNNPSSWSTSDSYDVYNVVEGSTYADAGYTLMFDIDKADINANSDFYFALSSNTANHTDMYWKNSNTVSVSVLKDDPDNFIDSYGKQNYYVNGENSNYNFGRIKVSPQNLLSLTGITVYVDTQGDGEGRYIVVPKGKTKPADTVTIYAKNGTLNTTSAYGTTTVTGINEECEDFTSLGTPYSTYYGLAGDRIIAQTEVNTTQAGYGWYVYAYVINGVEYLATKVNGTSSTYQMDTPYIVQEGQDVEITPIYLNTNIEKEDGYVTLYVDPNDLGDHWGNTISVYSYYYVGTSTKNAKEMNSAYPGEPMMLQSTGLYKAFIPKDAWEVNAKGVFAKVANCPVSGLTLNNYMEGETVHEKFLSPEQKNNYQTYDYDDFKIIAAAGYDTVKFDVKYRTNTTNQSSLLDNANDHPSKSGTTLTIDNYKDEWEDLTDIDGNLASIVGFTSNSVPSGATFDTTKAKKLYIVSTGNQNTSMGEWSTVWYVYDHSGNYITQGLPSDFIPRYTVDADGKQTIKDLTDQTDAYQAIYAAGYEYTSALIAYESEQDASTSSNSGNSGIRLDGRWYYARSDAELSVTTHVLYADSETKTKWTEDTYNSDLTGAYTGALATVEDVRDKTVSRNTSVTISASPSSKGTSELTYKFVGWATNVTKNDDGTYTPTKSTTLVDSTSIFSVVSDTDAYALYVPVGEGDLVVNHSAYSTVNSDANGGTGRYFVQAVVTHKDDTTNTYYAQNGVTVPITSDDKTVDITLYTVSTNGCSYVGSYVYNGLTKKYNDITANGGTSYVGKVNPASAPATVTHSIEVSKIFGGDNAQKLTSKLDYYSDLKTNTITVKLNYYDRKLVNGSPADISDKETTYTYKPATYPSSVYEKNAQGELVLKLSNLITYTVSNAVKPDNALDDYYYWTSQSEAVTKMSSMYNYHTGTTYGETPYHTDNYGRVQNTGDKWVTYYKADGTEIDEGHATAENVSTISIWYFNTPKKYSYTMSLATDSTDLAKNSSGTYYYGTKEVTGTKKLLYNQRLGGEDKTSTGNEASKYLQAYGVTKGYVDIKTDTAQNLEVTEKDGQNNTVTKALKFVGWATDTEGKNIVSTNYKYGLRITGNVKVYAIYGKTELNHPGVNVQGIKPEQYFDEKNVSKTRISTTFTPYNCEDNDPNIANIGIVYLRVANSTTEKALEKISDNDLKTLRYNIAKVVSKANYSSFKSGAVDTEASATIVSLSGSTASGFKYKVVDQINDNDTEKQAVLSNKNTGQITQIFSTSVIKGYTYYTFATMGYKNYPANSTDDSVYADTTDKNNVVTYITSDNFAKFEFNSNGVCVTKF